MRWMCRLTSSELEIDSLMADPNSRRSCLILSSTCPLSHARKLLENKQLKSACTPLLWQTALHWSIFQSRRQRRTLLRRFDQPVPHGAPQLGPVREVLPLPPFRVAPQHRLVGDAPSFVVALSHVAAEFGVD